MKFPVPAGFLKLGVPGTMENQMENNIQDAVEPRLSCRTLCLL